MIFEMKNIATTMRIFLVLAFSFILLNVQAFPGRGEEHGHDKGLGPNDPNPDPSNDKVPIDGGIALLLAGGVAAYLFGKKKKK
jgi:hypothetical protein